MRLIKIIIVYAFMMISVVSLINFFDIWNNGFLTMFFGWFGGVIAATLGLFCE